MKKADVALIFIKDDPTKAKNYRLVSVLPVVSKVFERIMYKQISEYVNQVLSPYLCGYRQGFNTQQALVSLTENSESYIRQKRICRSCTYGSLKSFWYHISWSLNNQTK